MMRLVCAVIATVLLAATAAPALASTKICTSTYEDELLCHRHCDFYDDQGNWYGSITEEYQC